MAEVFIHSPAVPSAGILIFPADGTAGLRMKTDQVRFWQFVN